METRFNLIHGQTVKDYLNDMIPTARFWLMTKLLYGWDKRWEYFINTLKQTLLESAINNNESTKKEIDYMITKIERSAWLTMPASFLSRLGIPRVRRF